jgi:tetratricopeptide (TPR) repeat protein
MSNRQDDHTQERSRFFSAIQATTRAKIALEQGQMAQAALSAAEALEAVWDHIPALALWAMAAQALGDRTLEQQLIARLVLTAPWSAPALSELGRLTLSNGQTASAVECFRRAVRLAPDQSGIWHNLARAEIAADRPAHAAQALAMALIFEPAQIDLWSDLIGTLREMAAFDRAKRTAEIALFLAPDHAGARWNRALVRLQTGDFAGGFADYEARLTYRPFQHVVRHQNLAPWTGDRTAGQHLLVWCEQGLGDAIQFARYVPLLRAQGIRITFETRRPLVALMRSLGNHDVIAQGDPLPLDISVVVAVSSLPHYFGGEIVYTGSYLHADPVRINHWRQWLEGLDPSPKRRIGLVWQGNPVGSIDRGRSIPLEGLGPLMDLPDTRFIVLQKQHGLDQIQRSGFSDRLIIPPAPFDDGPDGFLDTAALMMSLDMIISSDTATVHLAGALGRPCMVLLKAVPDWRWNMAGNTCPWYPSVIQIRQSEPGNWKIVVENALRFLRENL